MKSILLCLVVFTAFSATKIARAQPITNRPVTLLEWIPDLFQDDEWRKKVAASSIMPGSRKIRQEAERGLALAQYQLSRMYYIGFGAPKNVQESVRWCQKA